MSFYPLVPAHWLRAVSKCSRGRRGLLTIDPSPWVPSLVPAVSHQPDTVRRGRGARKRVVHSGFKALSLLTVSPLSTWHLYPQNPGRSMWLQSNLSLCHIFFFWSPVSNSVRSLRSEHISSVSRGCIYLKQPSRLFSRCSLSSFCIANVRFAISVSCLGFKRVVSSSARYFISPPSS